MGRDLLQKLLSGFVMVALLLSPPALIADKKKNKKTESRPTMSAPSAIRLESDRSSQISPSLVLSPQQGNALVFLFHGTVSFLHGTGSHSQALDSPFSQFLESLQSRFHNLPSDQIQVLQKMDFGLNSAARGWLVDNGFNPYFADALQAMTQGKSPLDFVVQQFAQQSGHPTERVLQEFRSISYKVPSGVGFTARRETGGQFGSAVSQVTQPKSFVLTNDGRPVLFDPTLANLLAHLDALKLQISQAAAGKDNNWKQRFAGHFTSLTGLYNQVWSDIDSLEMAALDLQGLLDSIRYKLTISEVDTIHEAEALNALLAEAMNMRNQLIRAAQPFVQLHEGTPQARLPLFKHLLNLSDKIEKVRVESKHLCSRAIDDMDRILGLDSFRSDQLKFDTPWELAFAIQRDQAKAEGLEAHWEEIKNFQIVTVEHYKTAHWTTREAVKNEKGEITGYRNVDHTSSGTDYTHETVPTPEYETRTLDQLQILRQALLDGAPKSTDGISKLTGDLRALYTEFARYGSRPPVGKDDSEHKLPRVRNILSQIAKAISQAEVLAFRSSQNMPVFNREAGSPPAWKNQVAAALNELDRSRRFRLWLIGGLTGLAVTGAGACQLLLNGGGGL